MGTRKDFLDAVGGAVSRFGQNPVVRRIEQGEFQLADYHRILLMIFHQTYEGPSSFALAAAHCDPRRHAVRDYLIHHAEEERDHWNWVISDLRATGYEGPDPRETFPHPACQAYVAFNVYTALRQPLARLGTASALESMGATYGKRLGTEIIRQLRLEPSQIQFFLGHGDTDVEHTRDLIELIDAADLTPTEWDWMAHAARTAGVLYSAMYEASLDLPLPGAS